MPDAPMPDPASPATGLSNDDALSPIALPEQPPMDDAAGGPQADDAVEGNAAEEAREPHTPVTD